MQRNSRTSRSKKSSVIRDSDIVSDPVYKQKVAFYKDLEAQLDAYIIEFQKRSESEINKFKRLISIQLTQLPSHIQNMKVYGSKMSDFIDSYGYKLDGASLKHQEDSDNDLQKTIRVHRSVPVISKLKQAEGSNSAIRVDLTKADNGQYIPQIFYDNQDYSLTSETISELDASTLQNIRNQIDIILHTLADAQKKMQSS